VLLAVPDEFTLWLWADKLDSTEDLSCFHEPDLDGQLTAVAFGPGAGPALRRLPLALSDDERG
jgi:hypothetical protein